MNLLRPYFTKLQFLMMVLMLSLGAAYAQSMPQPKEGVWVAKNFRFHTGEVMPELKLGYITIGDPAGIPVLILHGTAGTANRGGGGGGGGCQNSTRYTTGGNGGSGIVIIRYAGSQRCTGGTVTSSGGYTYHTFTSSGTYSA